MERMRRWLEKNRFGLEVSEGADDCVDFSTRMVRINSDSPYQIRISSLIHECGHVRIFMSRMRNPENRICGSTLSEQCLLVGRREPRARSSRISLLQEEMDAWEQGERLAKSLSVRYNRGVLERDRVRALMTYVNFTACRMRMCRKERTVRNNLEHALRGFVKFAVDRSKKRPVIVKKPAKYKQRLIMR
jgi:hypothetical protein